MQLLREAGKDFAQERRVGRRRFAALDFFDGGGEQAVKRRGDEVRHQAEAVVGEDEQREGEQRVEQPVQPGEPAGKETFDQCCAVVEGGIAAGGEEGNVYRERQQDEAADAGAKKPGEGFGEAVEGVHGERFFLR